MFSALCDSSYGLTNMQLKCMCMQFFVCLSVGLQKKLSEGAGDKWQMR